MSWEQESCRGRETWSGNTQLLEEQGNLFTEIAESVTYLGSMGNSAVDFAIIADCVV
jgi:hypothetical protein